MKSLKEIQKAYKDKTVSVRQLVDKALAKIKAEDESLGAILGLYSEENIKAMIDQAESMLATGTGNMLTGVPIVIKDNIMVKGELATAASKMLEHHVSAYDATVIQKLKDAGAVLIARTNMDEFAMGSATENSAFQKTCNPRDHTLIPGGSSGGSAAAVGAGYVVVALGSDTGGSVREPAAFTGLVGLKPTYGAVSRYGLIAMGSSLDQIGPLANSVEDAEYLFNIIKGKDIKDATSHDNISESGREKCKRVAVPRSFIDQDGVDMVIRERFNSTLEKFKAEGYEIVDVDIDGIDKTLQAYYILCAAEVSSNMGRYDGIRFGAHDMSGTVNESMIATRSENLGPEVKRRIMLGTYVLSSGYYDAYYNKALKLRQMIRDEMRALFREYDVVAMPITPIFPWHFGEKSDPLSAYLADVFSVAANVIGVPAIAVPTGDTDNNLPTSIQFLADWHREDMLFDYAKEVEKMYRK